MDSSEVFQQRCAELRGMIGTRRRLITLNCLIDSLLLITLFTVLAVTLPNYPLVPMVLIIVKLFLTLVLKGHKGNIAGLVMWSAAAAVCTNLGLMDGPTTAIFLMNTVVHAMRFRAEAAAKRIGSLYGAPAFNGFLIFNELEGDPALRRTVMQRYNEVCSDAVVALSLREQRLPRLLTVFRLAALALLSAGVGLAASGLSVQAKISNAMPAELITADDSGEIFSFTADKIYAAAGESSDGGPDSYWCRLGTQCLTVFVSYDDNKLRFAKLYNACADTDPYGLADLKTKEKDSSPIDFVGRVALPSRYRGTVPNLTVLENNAKNIDTQPYDLAVIILLNEDEGKKQTCAGALMSIIGLAGAAVCFGIVFKNNKNTPVNSEIFKEED